MVSEETIAVRTGENFDLSAIERYLRDHIEGLGEGTLQVRQFPSGASNLTYLLQVGTWEGVLRRPPFGPVPPKAHDMEREAGLLQKVHPVFLLAPKPYVFCNDLGIMGVPFYVMERKRGVVINDTFPPAVTPTEAIGRGISLTMVNTLVHIHGIDWQAAGLSTLGHPEGFLARQVKGWIERYFRAQTDELPQVEPLTRWLADHIPQSPAPSLIHNDFKMNNMLFGLEDVTQATAVLDWEMATIGDPLFDLAVSLCYWVQPDDPEEMKVVLPTVTTFPGFLTRAQFIEVYAQKSGRDISSMQFYTAFAYFKLAVILQQIYARWKRGQTQDARFEAFGKRVQTLVLYAASLIESDKL
ncbi:MAG: phosphotransferase family protein [Ktedonobacteraceae bacterium]